jgi:hypothetical protein
VTVMQGSLYNNPMFAQSLAGLVGSFIGNPAEAAQRELFASEALLNNQTAQYRDAIGDTGLQGDLASMMIRALQAGPEYSGNAPEIGMAAMGFNQMGQGSLGQVVADAILAQPAVAQAAPRPAAPQAMPAASPLLPPGPPTRVAAGQPMQPDANAEMVLMQARQAIAGGRNPQLVADRLRQMGIDPGLL